jgi:hypothetical protein
MLRLIGICALLYLAYWAGTNGYGVSELTAYVDSVVDTVRE